MSFWKSLTTWTVTLAVAVLVYSVLVRIAQGEELAFVRLAASVPGLVSALIPLTAFAAARGFGGGKSRALWTHLVGATILSYALVAGVYPLVQQRVGDSAFDRVTSSGDLYTPTPFELVRRKQFIIENPPPQYSLDVDQPLATPPNWLDFLIHSPIAFSLFTVLNGWLGAVLGRNHTAGSRRSARRLWLFGILASASFVVPAMAASDYVQASLSVSGVRAAWFPLLLPLMALLVCMRLVPHSHRRREATNGVESAPSRSS